MTERNIIGVVLVAISLFLLYPIISNYRKEPRTKNYNIDGLDEHNNSVDWRRRRDGVVEIKQINYK